MNVNDTVGARRWDKQNNIRSTQGREREREREGWGGHTQKALRAAIHTICTRAYGIATR